MWADVAAKVTMNQQPDTVAGKEEALNGGQAGHANGTQEEQGNASPEEGTPAPRRERLRHRGVGVARGTWADSAMCGRKQEKSDTPAPEAVFNAVDAMDYGREVMGTLHDESKIQLLNNTVQNENGSPFDGQGITGKKGSTHEKGNGRAESAPSQSEDEMRTPSQRRDLSGQKIKSGEEQGAVPGKESAQNEEHTLKESISKSTGPVNLPIK
jgi:hypothetical protein